MAKAVQIRDVDERTYTVLRTRAAAEGLTLSGYLRRELQRLASGPTMAEWLDRAIDRPWGVDRGTAVHTLRQIRDDENGDGR